jgi:hypothetical protein
LIGILKEKEERNKERKEGKPKRNLKEHRFPPFSVHFPSKYNEILLENPLLRFKGRDWK